MPYIALEAIKNVKQRQDLIPRVIEWTEENGNKVVEGLREQQNILRSIRDPEERKKRLNKIQGILSSEWSRAAMIALNLANGVQVAAGKKTDVESMKNVLHLTRRSSYSWLWSIRKPEVKEAWRSRMREIVLLPH
jgi:hypothetical protein